MCADADEVEEDCLQAEADGHCVDDGGLIVDRSLRRRGGSTLVDGIDAGIHGSDVCLYILIALDRIRLQAGHQADLDAEFGVFDFGAGGSRCCGGFFGDCGRSGCGSGLGSAALGIGERAGKGHEGQQGVCNCFEHWGNLQAAPDSSIPFRKS